MHNFKTYDISDAAQPAYVYRNGGFMNPAYPSDKILASSTEAVQPNIEILDALKHRLKRARKSKNKKRIRAVEALLREIKRG